MKYELAKELKEAGFKCKNYVSDGHFEDLPDPTLSELIEDCIEICGADFTVVFGKKQITCIATVNHQDCGIVASTSEDAFAHLWIALNKKI